MKVSLIICTRNRAISLARTLDSLTELTFRDPWEVIIVNNASTDNTETIVQSFSSLLPIRCHYEEKPGLSNARNAGLRAASGEFILFTDDDCYPVRDFLDKMVECFSEDPKLGFVGGRIMLYDPTDLKMTIKESMERELLQPGDFPITGVVQGANLAFRRKAVDQAGWFDPVFGAGAKYCAEDIDYAFRILSAGWFGVYDPRPVVSHHHGRKTAADLAPIIAGYNYGRGAYYAKCFLARGYRQKVSKHVYWDCRRRFSFRRKHRWRDTLQELSGAISYLSHRLRNGIIEVN